MIQHPRDDSVGEVHDGFGAGIKTGIGRQNRRASQQQQFKIFHMHQVQRRFARDENQLLFLLQHHVGGAEQEIVAGPVRDAPQRAHRAGDDHHGVRRIRSAGKRGVHAVTVVGPGARGQPQAGGQFFGEDLRRIVAEHDMDVMRPRVQVVQQPLRVEGAAGAGDGDQDFQRRIASCGRSMEGRRSGNKRFCGGVVGGMATGCSPLPGGGDSPRFTAVMAEPTPVSPPPRSDGRRPQELRPVRFHNHIAPHATGATLIECGQTRVICGVTIEESVPRWMKEQGIPGGWITAEYSMLPYSTLQRKVRDSTRGRIEGRTQEIQRLIGRAMRATVDLAQLGARTIWVDCDVLQADGGTRTAAITGSYVALALALRRLRAEGKLTTNPLLHAVAAVSVGLVDGQPLLDLCYTEDVAASVDFNLVMNAAGEFIELQGTGEEATFTESELTALLTLGKAGIRELLAAQQTALQT